jgi:hypothetical protein
MNLAACKRLRLLPIQSTWYGAISAKHWKAALRSDQTARTTSRFHPGQAAATPFEILYLADNPVVAYDEVGAIFGPPDQPVAHPSKGKIIVIDVSVRLQSVADMTDPTQQSLLGISLQELTGNWDTYQPGQAPTQRLGGALFGVKNIEGFLAISAKMPRCKTLIVFPQTLRKGSELVFADIITQKTHRVPSPP